MGAVIVWMAEWNDFWIGIEELGQQTNSLLLSVGLVLERRKWLFHKDNLLLLKLLGHFYVVGLRR